MTKMQPIVTCVFKLLNRGWSALCPQSGGKLLFFYRWITGLDEQQEQILQSCRIFSTARSDSV